MTSQFDHAEPPPGVAASLASARDVMAGQGSGYAPHASALRLNRRVSHRVLAAPDVPRCAFDAVLDRRHSIRTGGPVDVGHIGTLLAWSCRIRRRGETTWGVEETWRQAPSAGARHPFEVFVAALHVAGLATGLWWFDAHRSELVATEIDPIDLRRSCCAVADVSCWEGQPAAVAFVVADFMRTTSKYARGETLVWRDAGALLATMHLAATALQLNSCIVGTTAALLPAGSWREIDVGALAFGSPGA